MQIQPVLVQGQYSLLACSSALLVFFTSLHLSSGRPKRLHLPAGPATCSLCHVNKSSLPSPRKMCLFGGKNPFLLPCLKDQHTLAWLCNMKSIFSKNQQSALQCFVTHRSGLPARFERNLVERQLQGQAYFVEVT